MFYRFKISAIIFFLWSMAGVPAIQAAQQLSPAQENQQLALNGVAVAQEEQKASFIEQPSPSIPVMVRCEQSEPRTTEARVIHVEEETKESYDDFIDGLAAREKLARPQVHPLFIFLDSQEINSDSGFVFPQAQAALQQRPGPILITGFLLSILFNREALAFKKQHLANIFDCIYNDELKNDPGMQEHIEYQLKSGRVSKIIRQRADEYIDGFDSQQWVIRQVSEDLFLLIPTDYPFLGDSLENGLGLNISKMTKIKEIEAHKKRDSIQQYFALKYTEFKAKMATDPTGKKVAEQLLDALHNNVIFVPHNQHEWVIYLTGHGGFNNTIATISVHAKDKKELSPFQQFLAFLSTKINTKMLAYNSCNAAGLNAYLAYGDIAADSGACTYSFAIATSAIGDAVVVSPLIKEYDGSVRSALRFDLFAQAIKKSHRSVVDEGRRSYVKCHNRFFPVDSRDDHKGQEQTADVYQKVGHKDQERTVDSYYEATLAHIFPVIKKSLQETCFIAMGSLPQLRLPHSPLFKPIFDEKAGKVVAITKIMAATRQEPLVINNTVKAIVLETTHIPFAIFFDESVTKIPPFISILPDEAVHVFASIIALNERASFNVGIFNAIDYDAQAKKYFHIRVWTDEQSGTCIDTVIEAADLAPREDRNKPSVARAYAVCKHTLVMRPGLSQEENDNLSDEEFYSLFFKGREELMGEITGKRHKRDQAEKRIRIAKEAYAACKMAFPDWLAVDIPHTAVRGFERKVQRTVSCMQTIAHWRPDLNPTAGPLYKTVDIALPDMDTMTDEEMFNRMEQSLMNRFQDDEKEEEA